MPDNIFEHNVQNYGMIFHAEKQLNSSKFP